MSLIFQSLQALDANGEASERGDESGPPRRSSPRSWYIRWLLPISIGLVLVLALGCGAVYAVQYLKERLPDMIRPAERRERERWEPPDAYAQPMDLSVQPVEAQPALRSPETKSKGEIDDASRYHFHPPDPREEVAVGEPAARVEKGSLRSSETTAALLTPPSPLHSQKLDSGASGRADNTVQTAPPEVDPEREATERARRIALEKSARIGRLVRQIEQALAGSKEAGDPNTLLKKLARIKGENHPYVAKLRAYYNFQRGKYALAESDLHRVIAANPDDFEAGINLALIEIQFQRYEEALVRLKALRQAYPENEQIADLIKRLR